MMKYLLTEEQKSDSYHSCGYSHDYVFFSLLLVLVYFDAMFIMLSTLVSVDLGKDSHQWNEKDPLYSLDYTPSPLPGFTTP